MKKHKKPCSLLSGRYIAGDEPEEIVEDGSAEDDDEDGDEEEQPKVIFVNDNKGEQEKEIKLVGLYGSVNESKACGVIEALMYLRESCKSEKQDEEECEDIKFVLSTYGGDSAEAFAIYDTMKDIEEECDIATIGLGKVMSAGVLLLAAGTKGKRCVGRHARLMIHAIAGGMESGLAGLDVELNEIKFLQEQYIDCLSKDTKMTKTLLKKLLNKGTNHYFGAEQAIKWGIADQIL